MLVGISIGNYRSFKEDMSFSMEATKLQAKDKELDQSNIFIAPNTMNLLTSAAIYGANASGKSNFVAAIRFMKKFVLNSSRNTQSGDLIPVEPFLLSTETEHQPSFFEVVFLIDQIRYRYGFEVTRERVTAEWLYHTLQREALLFEREQDSWEISSRFKEGRVVQELTRDNALLLSVAAQFNGEISQAILRWFRNLDADLGLDKTHDNLRALIEFEHNQQQHQVINFINNFDIGIQDIRIEQATLSLSDMPEKLRTIFSTIISEEETVERANILTSHQKFDHNGVPVAQVLFDIEHHESEGTKKLFALAYPIISALHEGKIIIIDELDARLHPLITWEIIKLFNSPITNPKHGQLIFTTHDTNLLSSKLFRRDQIWFAEKNTFGATQLYSLVEYKVRNDASFEKNYIEGRYGAIPFIGDFSTLMEQAHVEEIA